MDDPSVRCPRCSAPRDVADPARARTSGWPPGSRALWRCDACGSASVVVTCGSCGSAHAVLRRAFTTRPVCPRCEAVAERPVPGSVFPQLGRWWPRPARDVLDGARSLLQAGAELVERPFTQDWHAPGPVRWIVGLTWTVLLVSLVYVIGGWLGVAVAAVLVAAVIVVIVKLAERRAGP